MMACFQTARRSSPWRSISAAVAAASSTERKLRMSTTSVWYPRTGVEGVHVHPVFGFGYEGVATKGD
jgi:hypothetical protein